MFNTPYPTVAPTTVAKSSTVTVAEERSVSLCCVVTSTGDPTPTVANAGDPTPTVANGAQTNNQLNSVWIIIIILIFIIIL